MFSIFPRAAMRAYLLGSATLMLGATPVMAQTADRATALDIPAQSLSGALTAIGHQTGINILYPAELVAGRSAKRLQGTMTAGEAVTRVLAGHDLVMHRRSDGTIVIMSPKAPAPTAYAEEPSPDDLIVVTGFRASISKARDIKRRSATNKEVIVAEDMAKFPELNLAESLQRVSGVAINREAGEGRRITLRGLGPDFTRVQLNGMEVLGNVDSAMDSRGQRSRDRAFDFNIFASELFSRVEVEKTYQASQNEGGMAGTVGLFTAKPLENDEGFTGVISAKAGTNSYTEDFQPRVAAMAGYNFDDRLGVLVSVAWSRRQTQEQGYDTYNPAKPTAAQLKTYLANGLDISALTQEQQAKFLSGDLLYASGNRLSVWDAKQERLGITLSTQWAPSDRFKLTFDGLYGQFSTDRNEYHLATRPTGSEIIFNGAYSDFGKPIAATKINDLRWDASDFVYYADVDNATYGSEHRRQVNRNKFRQLALTGEWEASDSLSFDALIGYEKSTYETPIDDKLYLQAQGGMITEYAPDGESATNIYDWDTTDPNKYSIRELYFRENGQDTSLTEGKFTAHFKASPVFTINAGYGYRKYDTSGWDLFNDGLYAQEFRSKPGYDAVTEYYTVYDGHKDHSWVVGDWDRMFAHYGKSHTAQGANVLTYNTFSVQEETHSGFLQLDWNGDIGGMVFRGNAGARAYKTKITNTGLVADFSGTRRNETVESDYSGVLPAVNAVLEITPSFQIRASAAKNINRPALASMKLTGRVQLNNGQYYVTNGNPDLKPYKSLDLDLAAEWYFGDLGLLSVGVFHKKIDDLVTTQVLRDVPYSVTGLSTDLAPGLTPDTIVTEYSRPVNLSSAKLNGLEMAGQANLAFLPAPFDNFGVLANLTLIDSNSVENGLDGKITGLSDVNANGTLYYETDHWGIRGSANYRSGYLRTRYDGSNPTTEDGFKGTIYVDASAFVVVRPGMRLTIDAINITDQPEIQINSTSGRLHNVTRSGTTFFAGLNLSF
ncbi:MAG TPA: TonB-dependent receptor [Sphingomonadaceae bacterium]|nr:TonB-dependent receptor [Sphingomonadaceae bacterium]